MSQKTPRLSYFSVLMYTLTGRRAYRGGPDSQAGFLQLTTTGRKSGKRRTSDLIYIRDGSAYVVTASNGGRGSNPGWFFNLQSNPDAQIHMGDTQMRVVAEVAGPEKRRELWARLVQIAPMYSGYEKRTQREIPMVVLNPVADSGAASTSAT
jgi:deazaflavin-dependent oxidoreductase (nitroreductase family)